MCHCYKKSVAREASCTRFCKNVCSLFSSGRSQCVADCLACRKRVSPVTRGNICVREVEPAKCDRLLGAEEHCHRSKCHKRKHHDCCR